MVVVEAASALSAAAPPVADPGFAFDGLYKVMPWSTCSWPVISLIGWKGSNFPSGTIPTVRACNGGLEADVVEDGTADFGSEAGFYYWGPKHYVKPVEDEPEKGKKDKRKKKKRRNRKIIIEDIDDDDLLAARKGRKTPRKTPRNDKTPRSGKTPRKTPKSTPRKTHQNTPRNTPRKTPREEREARRQRQKDIANLGDAEFEAEIIRQRAEKRKKRHLKQRMAATSGDGRKSVTL